MDWSRTKNGIAARLLHVVTRLFDLPTLVVCDSWFANYSLLCELHRTLGVQVHMLSRLRVSCVLYDMPERKKNPGRGRPRKYGERLQGDQTRNRRARQPVPK